MVLVLPVLHLSACLAIGFGLFGTGASTHAGGWNWFALFLLDFPASILLMRMALNFNQPGLTFGIGGTLWWLLISLIVWWFFRGLAWLVRMAIGRSRAPE